MRPRPIYRFLSILFLTLLLSPVIILLWYTMVAYYPPKNEKLAVEGKASSPGPAKKIFRLLSWNTGYAGLGMKMDFFYEGGKRVRPEKAEFENYLSGIQGILAENADSIDFYFLQETDVYSKRSYFTDEPAFFSEKMPGFCRVFAKNYDCRFVPLPLSDPMGRTVSGLAVFSRFYPEEAQRVDYGTSFGWPKQLFFLRRCFMILRYPLQNGKELILVNTHNSTYDKKGELRLVELDILQKFLLSEYDKGNYVIAGGDWNTNPPGFDPSSFRTGDKGKRITPPLPGDFLQGWTFAFDPSTPSNRDVDAPYVHGKTLTTIIDFFAISPNIRVLSVNTVQTGFAFSDHQPVIITTELK